MRYIVLSLLAILLSCKKEKKPQIIVPESSERFKTLTGHRWAMTHEYSDSTAYAKSHLNEWPFSTTNDSMDRYDTCLWDSESIFLPDGTWKLKKSKSCDSSISENVGNWKLTNNDNDFEIVGQGTMHIVELSSNEFKMYYTSDVYIHQQLIRTDYVMWTFHAR